MIRKTSQILIFDNEFKKANLELFVYDIYKVSISGCTIVNNVQELFLASDIVLANRIEPELEKYREKVFTRDIFSRN